MEAGLQSRLIYKEKGIMQFKRNLCVALFVCAHALASNYSLAASYGSATWDEADNQIELSTVCANHTYGSISSRKCRARVSKYFVKQCKAYKKKYSAASTKNRTKYKNGKSKFCYAARRFKIVD